MSEANETIEIIDSDNNSDDSIITDIIFPPDHSGITGFIRQKYRLKYFPTLQDCHYEKETKVGGLNKDANVEYEVVSSEMTGTITFSNVCTDLQQEAGPFSGLGQFRFEI